MLHQRRILRRHAARLLAAWLFGVVMSVANACALGPHDEAAGHAAAAERSHARDDAASQAGANCLDFCEKTALGSSPAPKLADDNPTLSAPPALVPGHALPMLLQQPSVARARQASTAWRGSPPTRIVYQRLAL